MVRIAILFAALAVAALPMAAKDLEIYFIDVEGGQATLIVSPTGESMLVDAGWFDLDGRNAGRIIAAAKLAGLERIDLMLMTHYHLDHLGGIAPLAAKFPIVAYFDHGPNNETDAAGQILSAVYNNLVKKGRRTVLKPGDKIPLEGVEIDVVAANGDRIPKALPGAGAPNAACASVAPKEADPTENARSVAFILRYGKFRFADFADLTWNKELALACPNNLVGGADVYLVTHHGVASSNSPPILAAVRPRVAIMNNGARKGGAPAAFQAIRNAPGFEDLWQLHYAMPAGKENDANDQFIANPEAKCEGKWLKLTASSDGSFTVLNSRNGFTKTYQAQGK